jgi:hypothetical protein
VELNVAMHKFIKCWYRILSSFLFSTAFSSLINECFFLSQTPKADESLDVPEDVGVLGESVNAAGDPPLNADTPEVPADTPEVPTPSSDQEEAPQTMLHNAAEPEKASSTTLATFNEDSADSYISAIEEGEEEEPTEENGEPKRFPKITIHIGAIPPEENANLEVAQEGPVKCIINRALIQDEDSNLSTKSARSGTRTPSRKRMANNTVANELGHAGHQE